MNELRQLYEKLPEEAKDELFRLLNELLLWRGWNVHTLGGVGAERAEKIAQLFHEHLGVSLMEYT